MSPGEHTAEGPFVKTSHDRKAFFGLATELTIMMKVVGISLLALTLAACGDTWGQRAVTGGGIGAGTGALVGALTPIGLLPGALVGGAVGAGVGAATTPRR
jgi:small-conductance mechanosensitive channel